MRAPAIFLTLYVLLCGVKTVHCNSLRNGGSSFTLINKEDGTTFLSNEVHQARRLEDGQVYHPDQLQLRFEHNGVSHEIDLDRHPGSIREGVTATVHQEDGTIVKVELPNTYSYYNKEMHANLNFRDHTHFTVLVLDGEESIYFEAKEGEMFVEEKIHKHFEGSAFPLPTKSHVEAFHDFQSEGDRRKLEIEFWDNCFAGQSRGIQEFSVGYAIAFELMKDLNFNQGSAAALINDVTSKSNLIYVPQMSVRIVTDDVELVTSQGGPSWNNPGCSKSISQQLYGLQGSPRPSRRGLWHLLDKCFGFSGNTLGIAKVGVLCRTPANVGVSYETGTSAFNTGNSPTWATVAHEFGHNFNAAHSFENGQGRTGGIMDYGPVTKRKIDNTIQFNTPLRKRQVCAELNRVVNTCGFFRQVVSPTPAPTNPPVSGGVSLSDCQVARNQVFFGKADVFIGSFEDWTVGTCFQKCANTPGCRSFVVSENRRYCELWSAAKSAQDLESFPGYDTFFCPFTSVGSGGTSNPAARVCQKRRNAAIVGRADVYSGSYDDAWSLETCKEGCLKDPKCGSFTFSDTYKYCEYWSKSKDFGDLTRFSFYDTYFCFDPNSVPKSNIQSLSIDDLVVEFNLASLKSSCCQNKPGQYFLGPNVFVAEGLNEEECGNLCVETSECKASTFNNQDGTCELWGEDFPDVAVKPVEDPGFSATICSRSCIAGIVQPPGNRAAVILAVAGVAAAMIIAALFVISYKRKHGHTPSFPGASTFRMTFRKQPGNKAVAVKTPTKTQSKSSSRKTDKKASALTNSFKYSAYSSPPPNTRSGRNGRSSSKPPGGKK